MTELAASVRARLLGYARAQRLEFQSVLVPYGVERLLIRMAGSPHADRFVLKGAQLLRVHAADVYRPTRDLDLLGFGSDDADDLVRVFREICGTTVEPDGLWFDASSVTGEAIRETATYGGVRVKLLATLERARIPLQVDVGFGDVMTPMAEIVRFPVLLGGPAPTGGRAGTLGWRHLRARPPCPRLARGGPPRAGGRSTWKDTADRVATA